MLVIGRGERGRRKVVAERALGELVKLQSGNVDGRSHQEGVARGGEDRGGGNG